MDFRIQKISGIPPNKLDARRRELYDEISDGKIAQTSRFARAFETLKPFADTWWSSVPFKENMLRLLNILAKEGLNGSPVLTRVPLDETFVKRLSDMAPSDANLSVAIGSWNHSIPFNDILGSMLMLSASLIKPPSSHYPISITFERSLPGTDKPELYARVVGLMLTEGAGAFRPAMEEIAGSMGGIAEFNHTSISFRFPLQSQ